MRNTHDLDDIYILFISPLDNFYTGCVINAANLMSSQPT